MPDHIAKSSKAESTSSGNSFELNGSEIEDLTDSDSENNLKDEEKNDLPVVPTESINEKAKEADKDNPEQSIH